MSDQAEGLERIDIRLREMAKACDDIARLLDKLAPEKPPKNPARYLAESLRTEALLASSLAAENAELLAEIADGDGRIMGLQTSLAAERERNRELRERVEALEADISELDRLTRSGPIKRRRQEIRRVIRRATPTEEERDG